jgi:hypothetical protein
MRSRRFLAAAGISAALLVGGVAGFVLGVPGVSGAQTTDTTGPPTTEPPAGDEAPAEDGARIRGNCQDKEARGSNAEGTGIRIQSFRSL